jgi:3-hydroxyisobutyrate dehydrogenase-like beta-hydroxyacid dehydrogenase
VERQVSAFTRIALIGFGEVGQILADDLAKAGVKHISAYDILFDDPASIPSRAVAKRDVRKARGSADAAREAELVISAVTAASDLDAARAAVEGLAPGTFYLDLNSASPGMKQKAAMIVDASGGRYVEAAVMTPFPPKRIASHMLLGGPQAEDFLARATPLGFKAEVYSREVGKASATKMCRSVMIKGIEALLMESMLTARYYGVEKTVLSSLSDLLPVGDWEKLARYMISRSLEHGLRRAEEMREVANTVAEAGVAPLMSSATAERQDWAAEHKSALAHEKLAALLDSVLKDIDGKRP